MRRVKDSEFRAGRAAGQPRSLPALAVLPHIVLDARGYRRPTLPHSAHGLPLHSLRWRDVLSPSPSAGGHQAAAVAAAALAEGLHPRL